MSDPKLFARAELSVLADVHQGSSTGRKLRRSYFDSFPHRRRRAMALMWEGYIEHAPGGYLRLTQKGRIAIKAGP